MKKLLPLSSFMKNELSNRVKGPLRDDFSEFLPLASVGDLPARRWRDDRGALDCHKEPLSGEIHRCRPRRRSRQRSERRGRPAPLRHHYRYPRHSHRHRDLGRDEVGSS